MLKFIKRPYANCVTLIFTFCIVSMATSTVFGQLQFNFLDVNGNPAASSVDPVAVAGFQAAADRWSDIFDDPITVNIEIVFEPILSATGTTTTILGSTGSSITDSVAELGGDFPTFSFLKASLGSDVTSINDQIAFDNLPDGQPTTVGGAPATVDGSPVLSMTFRTNDRDGSFTLDNDTAVGDAFPANNIGNNNTFFAVTSANAKALGLIAGDAAGIDAQITFNSDLLFDFDPSDGITAGAFDFIGVATHEIGHALGVISGVDTVDGFSAGGPSDAIDFNGAVAGVGELDGFALFSTFDLFRRSEAAFALDPDALDLSTDTGVFFSIDGVLGDGNDLPLETGSFSGTGNQASHLADGLGLGILDPTAAPGELLGITDNDILLLDVIGFDLIEVFSLGDVNQDGLVNFLDIAPFIAVLASGEFQAEADTDENGVVNFLDIPLFISLLSS